MRDVLLSVLTAVLGTCGAGQALECTTNKTHDETGLVLPQVQL